MDASARRGERPGVLVVRARRGGAPCSFCFYTRAPRSVSARAHASRRRAARSLFGFRNQDTNETTALGAPQPVWPDPWEEVRDPASGQIYWWNPTTNETTAVGAPKPTSPAGIAAAAKYVLL